MAAQQSTLKTPPVLVDETTYAEWKNDVQIWQLFTDLAKKKQGPAVYLSLTGHARECVRDLTPAVIGGDDGVQAITDKLDTLFLQDENTLAYIAFKEFYDYKRPSGVNITDFLVRFEYIHHKLGKHSVTLPEGVQAFFLLNAANVSEENERLARATCGTLTYANMKACIKKIFGDPAACGNDGSAPAIKSEPVFSVDHEHAYQASGYNRNWRGSGRGSGRGGRGYGGYTNPVGKDGKIMRCYKCGSTKHFSRYCNNPNYGDRKSGTQDIHITLFNVKPDKAMSALVKETLGMGILDCACTKTVTGETWLDLYLDTLSDRDKN